MAHEQKNSVEDNMNEMRAEYNKLHALLQSNKQLYDAFKNDPVVHTWLKRVEMGEIKLEPALTAITVSLIAQKQVFFDEIIKLTSDFGRIPQEPSNENRSN